MPAPTCSRTGSGHSIDPGRGREFERAVDENPRFAGSSIAVDLTGVGWGHYLRAAVLSSSRTTEHVVEAS
jgi:hypothetical protein